jgi:hypothetical protein
VINLKTDRLMKPNFQPLVPEQVKFNLNAPQNLGERTFRTLRLYEPYDPEEEQKIPVYSRQKYPNGRLAGNRMRDLQTVNEF